MLTVTNGNDFNFAGRFNGIDFQFPAGKTTALPEDAAKHIFGVGLADKTDVLVRHGWMTSGAMFAAGMAILNKFSFNVADQVEAGEIIDPIPEEIADEEPEQGSAPLQTGSAVEAAAPDGAAVEAAQPTPTATAEEDEQDGVLGFFKSKSKKGS